MMLNKKKFNTGLKKITIAILLAFIGPVLFMFGTGNHVLITLIGGTIMIAAFIIGLIGLKEILNSFFEEPNE